MLRQVNEDPKVHNLRSMDEYGLHAACALQAVLSKTSTMPMVLQSKPAHCTSFWNVAIRLYPVACFKYQRAVSVILTAVFVTIFAWQPYHMIDLGNSF